MQGGGGDGRVREGVETSRWTDGGVRAYGHYKVSAP
jgi:hypothetical protein